MRAAGIPPFLGRITKIPVSFIGIAIGGPRGPVVDSLGGVSHDMKLPPTKRSLVSLLDSIFIGVCAASICGISGSLILQLPFHSDYRHVTVAVGSLIVGVASGFLWFVRHR
jgi:hypothetical protein